ncbi:MAG: hypothetical protein WCB53_09690 [Terriglobales bacterium]
MNLERLVRAVPRSCCSALLAVGQAHEWALNGVRPMRVLAFALAPPAFFLIDTRDEVYNILWVLVFGFATLNILSLGARRFEPHKRGLNFGEVLAILIVVISIVLLGWEMLYVFHILPIRLAPR